MRIAITGCGWVTPRIAGDICAVLKAYADTDASANSLSRYEPIQPEVFARFTNLPGEAAKEDAVRLAAVALEIAWKQSGLTPENHASHRKGLVLGCALAGVSGMIDFANDVRTQSTRFVSPIRFPQTVGNYICGALARGYDFRGPASTIACGSASSLEAIREACALLSSGLADVVLAGGSERLSPSIVEGLNQPDIRFSDGACMLVLEDVALAKARGANMLATISRNNPASPLPNRTEDVVVSAAGFVSPESISIEQWIGRTLGADGAAALAAAIGATSGKTVPRFKSAQLRDSTKISAALIRAADTANRIHELWIDI